MTEKYLIDTCIWIDAYDNRSGWNEEQIGWYALKLLIKLLTQKKVIIITDLILTELAEKLSDEEIFSLLNTYEKNTEKMISVESEIKEAKELSLKRSVPKGDALHAIMARNHELILVSRDKHFNLLKDIAVAHKPEDII